MNTYPTPVSPTTSQHSYGSQRHGSVTMASPPLSPMSQSSSAYGRTPGSPPWAMVESPVSTTYSESYVSPASSHYSSAYEADKEEMMGGRKSTATNQRALAMLENALIQCPNLNEEKAVDRPMTKKEAKRTDKASVKALNLFDSAVAGKSVHTINNDGSLEIKYLKSDKDRSREEWSNARALALLNNTVATRREREDLVAAYQSGAYQQSGHYNDEPGDDEEFVNEMEDVASLRSCTDRSRQKGACLKANIMLSDAVAGNQNGGVFREKSSKPTGLTAHEAAQLRYEALQAEEKALIKEKKKVTAEEAYLKRQQKIQEAEIKKFWHPDHYVPHRQEALAESTRKKPPQPNIKDADSIAGMKCQLDWEREKWAQEKALRLLNQGLFY